jgi:uncharacterized repeat protein (TIGR03803 family)
LREVLDRKRIPDKSQYSSFLKTQSTLREFMLINNKLINGKGFTTFGSQVPRRAIPLIELLVVIAILAANATHAAPLTVLFDFNGINGSGPNGPLVVSGNVIYGTTVLGNINANANPAYDGTGTIFRINTNGTGFTNLYNFSPNNDGVPSDNGVNSDGADPIGGLVLCGNVLYGTASAGGVNCNGTIFRIKTDGTGFTNIHNFSAFGFSDDSFPVNGDGAFPMATLVLSNNTLYGTALRGGAFGNGTVFKINTDGSHFQTLHSFSLLEGPDEDGSYGNGDGCCPQGRLLLSGNTLYGTTREGGYSGMGVIFKVNIDGTGFTNLHSFSHVVGYSDIFTNSDGAHPIGGLTLVSNTLYGMTLWGGFYGAGTIFKINTNGTGFTVLYGNAGGGGDMLFSENLLYGVTSGEWGWGVFAVNTDWTDFTVLYSYINPDDFVSDSSLAISGNTLYGTGQDRANPDGGAYDAVFALKPLIILDSDQTNYTFESGWTYYVTATVTIYGTTTIKGGAVIKYAPDWSAEIIIDGTQLICSTTPDNPAIFTAQDDDSVGAIIPGSTGSPADYYNGGAIWPWDGAASYPYGNGLQVYNYNGASVTLHDCKFYYLGNAVQFGSGDGWNSWQSGVFTLQNVQAFHCGAAVQSAGACIKLQNCLFANNGMVWCGSDTFGSAEQVTVSHCWWLASPTDGGGSSLYVTNSLIIGVQYYSDDLVSGMANTVTTNNDAGVFQTAGNDRYYLATGSPYRDIGTTDIDSDLLIEIRQMTTYAPQDGGWPDTNAPDLGYHYARQ